MTLRFCIVPVLALALAGCTTKATNTAIIALEAVSVATAGASPFAGPTSAPWLLLVSQGCNASVATLQANPTVTIATYETILTSWEVLVNAEPAVTGMTAQEQAKVLAVEGVINALLTILHQQVATPSAAAFRANVISVDLTKDDQKALARIKSQSQKTLKKLAAR